MSRKRTFGDISFEFGRKDTSMFLLQSIPYDGTSTWGKGADKGFEAFLEAAENMELYDIETDSEVYKQGIHLLPEWSGFKSPEVMYQEVLERTHALLETGKRLSFFGGEHSISIPILDAYSEKFEDLSVLQIDAHADLRPSYLGTEFNHACAMFRASQKLNLVQLGIRSMDVEEKQFVQAGNCFYAHQLLHRSNWIEEVLERLGETVYISFDLDALDPSIMPATGTPEPGGLLFFHVNELLRWVFENKRVVGFDLVELAPIPGLTAPQFLVAKLYYKMLTYWNHYGK